MVKLQNHQNKVAHRVAHRVAHGPGPRFCPHPEHFRIDYIVASVKHFDSFNVNEKKCYFEKVTKLVLKNTSISIYYGKHTKC